MGIDDEETNHEEKLTPESSSAEEKEISERLKFSWEQYNKLPNLLISLTTGTILLFGNIMVQKNDFLNLSKMTCTQKYIAAFSLFSLLVCLLATIIWRSYSQIGMEKEVYGNRNKMKRYLAATGMQKSFTSFFYEKEELKIIRRWKIAHTISLASLFLGWILMTIFLITLFF